MDEKSQPKLETEWQKYQRKVKMVEAMEATTDGIIETLEGAMKFHAGDYIVRGIKGELYPVQRDIFFELYDRIWDGEV